jgi:hypothetical protein
VRYLYILIVFAVAAGQAESVFEDAEKLFFRCIELHSKAQTSSLSQIKAAIRGDIDTFLRSYAVMGLSGANWRIAHSLTCLLRAALNGCRNIPFRAGLADSNSRGLYAILVNRLRSRVPPESPIQLDPPIVTTLPAYFEDRSELDAQQFKPTYPSERFITGNAKLLMSIATQIIAYDPSVPSPNWVRDR